MKIGVAIFSEFGPKGRPYFHLISRVYENYNEEDCDKMYNRCEIWGTDIRIETFFYYCKVNGIIRRREGMVYDPDTTKK